MEWLGCDEPMGVDLEGAEARVAKANHDGSYQILVFAGNRYFLFKRATLTALEANPDEDGCIYVVTTKEIWDSWGRELPIATEEKG
ncbi:MAG: hypothetical protein IKF75_01855 [Lachnospiraceae bacterium]|nr:hypothetical protein [Lachnospiraceae bacterium]